jgi:predicted permease
MPGNFHFRYALRTLRKSPGFTAAAVLSLALGIAANSAIFSLVNGLLLHPAAVDHPEQVVVPRVKYTKLNLKSIVLSLPDFANVRDSRDVFETTAAATTQSFNYTGGDVPERLVGATVTWQWFDVLKAKPLLGRGFRKEDDQPGANRIVMLSYGVWQRLFGGDRTVVGRTVELNNTPYRVAGVMPADFRWPTEAEIWLPLGLPASSYAVQNRYNENYFVIARMRPGVTFERASNFMRILTQRDIDHDPQGAFAKAAQWSMFVVPLTEFTAGDLKKPMFILLGAVGFVLLIACSNIAGLLLVRGTGRARELAIRTALGAQRGDLIRQALAESVLLGGAGTIIGLFAATGVLGGMVALAPAEISSGIAIRIDAYVLWFTAGVGALSVLLFGLAPAWHIATLGSSYDQLKQGGRSDTEGRSRHKLRAALVMGQVALALVLLAGAGLFTKSLVKMREVQTGFQTQGVMAASVALPASRYKDDASQISFFRSAVDRLSQTPGVLAAGAVDTLPFSGQDSSASFTIEGRVQNPGDPGPHGDIRAATPGYFAAMRIPLRLGRLFTDADRAGTQPVALVDETLAREYWPNRDPVGQRIRNDATSPWATIVGVVGHVKQSHLVGDSGKGVYYYAMMQKPRASAYFTVRTTGDPERLTGAIRRAVRDADANQAVFDMKSMDQRVANAVGPQRFAVVLLSVFAAVSLLMAALGLYGVISYGVTQRTREIGIRTALGADRRQILGMVIGQGMRLVAVGAAGGLVLALLLGRVVAAQLFEVNSFDPGTFLLTALLLAVAAFLAAYIPAWRATRVDPTKALRHE